MNTRYSEGSIAALLTPRSEITRQIQSGNMRSLEEAVKTAKSTPGCEDLLREAVRATGDCATGSHVPPLLSQEILRSLYLFEDPDEVLRLAGLVYPTYMISAARRRREDAGGGFQLDRGLTRFLEAWGIYASSVAQGMLTPNLMATLYSMFDGKGAVWGPVLGGDLPMPEWMLDLFTRYREVEKIVTDVESGVPEDCDASVFLSFTPDEVGILREMEGALERREYKPAQFISVANRILGTWGEGYPPAMEEGLSEYYFDICEVLLLLCEQEEDVRMVTSVLDLMEEEEWDALTDGELACDDVSIRLAVAFARIRKKRVMLYRYRDEDLKGSEVDFIKENPSLFGFDGSDAVVVLDVSDWEPLIDEMSAEELVKVFLSFGDVGMAFQCGRKGKTLRWWLGKFLEEKGGEGTFSDDDLGVVRAMVGNFTLKELLDVLAGNTKEAELLSLAWNAGCGTNITAEGLESLSPEQYATLFEKFPMSQNIGWLSREEIPAVALDAIAESKLGTELLHHITAPQQHYKDVGKFRELAMGLPLARLRYAAFATRIVSELNLIPDTTEAAAIINSAPESITVADLVELL